jgi:hypothetical protein
VDLLSEEPPGGTSAPKPAQIGLAQNRRNKFGREQGATVGTVGNLFGGDEVVAGSRRLRLGDPGAGAGGDGVLLLADAANC